MKREVLWAMMFCKVGSLTSKNDTYFGNFQPTGEESTFILDLFQGDFQGTRMAWGAFFVQVFFLYCKFLFSFCVLRGAVCVQTTANQFPLFFHVPACWMHGVTATSCRMFLCFPPPKLGALCRVFSSLPVRLVAPVWWRVWFRVRFPFDLTDIASLWFVPCPFLR